jgi:hypothetical protein
MIALWFATLVACGDLTRQETWELIGVTQDLAVVDARFSVTNTGVLKGQGHARFDFLFHDQMAIYYGRDGLPEETQTTELGGMSVGPDTLRLQEDGTWNLQIKDNDARARLDLRPLIGGPSPLTWETEDGDWTLEAPVVLGELVGVVSAGPRGALIQGHGVLTHRHGSAPPAFAGTERLAVYILGDGITVGLDLTGSRAISWAIVGDYAFDARDARFSRQKKGRLILDLRPTADLVVHILPRKPRSIRHPWEHLHRLERWLLKAWHGTPVRRTQGARANLLIGGEALQARAVIVEVTWE